MGLGINGSAFLKVPLEGTNYNSKEENRFLTDQVKDRLAMGSTANACHGILGDDYFVFIGFDMKNKRGSSY